MEEANAEFAQGNVQSENKRAAGTTSGASCSESATAQAHEARARTQPSWWQAPTRFGSQPAGQVEVGRTLTDWRGA
jgi:hypothetical protein